MGSKTLPDQGRQVSASPGLEAFFVALGLGYCTSAEAEKQEVFSSQAYQFLTRLYQEYAQAKNIQQTRSYRIIFCVQDEGGMLSMSSAER